MCQNYKVRGLKKVCGERGDTFFGWNPFGSSDHSNRLRSVGAALGLLPVEAESNLSMAVARDKATDSQLAAAAVRLKAAHTAESVARQKAQSAAQLQAQAAARLKATAAELGIGTIEIDGEQLLLVEPTVGRATAAAVDQWTPDIVIGHCREVLATLLARKDKQPLK